MLNIKSWNFASSASRSNFQMGGIGVFSERFQEIHIFFELISQIDFTNCGETVCRWLKHQSLYLMILVICLRG